MTTENLQSKHIKIYPFMDPSPGKSKPKWKLYVDRDESGNVTKIYTGYYPDNKPTFYRYDWVDGKRVEKPEPVWEPVQPFVFEGGLIPGGAYRGRSAAGMSFAIDGMDCSVEMHIGGVEDMLKSLCEGKHFIDKGVIKGLWTFHKGGANVFVQPLDYKVP